MDDAGVVLSGRGRMPEDGAKVWILDRAMRAHDDGVPAAFRHRIQAAWIGGIVGGGLHVICVYLRDSEGRSDSNLEILGVLTGIIRTLKGPWIVMGDWNVEPAELVRSNWLHIVKGTIHAPKAPTCHQHAMIQLARSRTQCS